MKSVRKYRLVPIDQISATIEEEKQTDISPSSDKVTQSVGDPTEPEEKVEDSPSQEATLETKESPTSDISATLPPPGIPGQSITATEAAQWQAKEGEKSQKMSPLQGNQARNPPKIKRGRKNRIKRKPKWINL